MSTTLALMRSEGNSAPPRGECKYCAELFGSPGLPDHVWNTRLLETEHFVVVPSLGALVEGWLLVVPRDHYVCAGALPSRLDAELESLGRIVRRVVQRAYCSPVVFEHGPKEPGLSIGCGIDHAHLHVVPLAYSLTALAEPYLRAAGSPWHAADAGLRTIRELHEAGLSYLHVEEPGRGPVCSTPSHLPSQFLRKLIASAEGIPDLYNYREHSLEGNVVATVSRLRPLFAGL